MSRAIRSRKKAQSRRKRSHSDAGEPYGYNISRTLGVLEHLAKGPATTEELSIEFSMSGRTTLRFMSALEKAGAPIYIRKKPGGKVTQQWDIDVDRFIAKFKRKNGANT